MHVHCVKKLGEGATKIKAKRKGWLSGKVTVVLHLCTLGAQIFFAPQDIWELRQLHV